MNFCVDSQSLKDSINSVTKAQPVRTSMPVLDGILIRADAKGVHVLCSDLMMQKECLLPATVSEEGECVVSSKRFVDYVKRIPDDNAFFSLNGKTLTLRCGKAVSQFPCIEYEEFPIMEFRQDDMFELTLKKEHWKRIIDRTAFAVGVDDVRPMLAGVYMEIGAGTVTTVATDSFQFAMNSLSVEDDLPEKSLIIPGRTVMEVSHMTDESADDKFTLTLSRTHIRANTGNVCLVARLLDGKYIEYKRLIPKECRTRVLMDKAALEDAVGRSMLVAREGNNSVKLSFRDDTLFINAESVAGKSEEEISAQIMGPDIDIAFNPQYLINVLKNLSGEKIYLEMNSSLNPCVFKPQNEEGALYLIVPMRVL